MSQHQLRKKDVVTEDKEDEEIPLKELIRKNLKKKAQPDVDPNEEDEDEDADDLELFEGDEDEESDLNAIMEMYFLDPNSGQNIAEILVDLKKSIDKQNKIMLKVAHFFMTQSES